MIFTICREVKEVVDAFKSVTNESKMNLSKLKEKFRGKRRSDGNFILGNTVEVVSWFPFIISAITKKPCLTSETSEK